MAKRAHIGRPSLYGSTAGGIRIQANLTREHSLKFKRARRRLAQLLHKDVEKVSQAEVIAFQFDGEQETIRRFKLEKPST